MKQALFSLAAAAATTLVALGAMSTSLAGQGGTGTITGHVHYMGPTPVLPIIRMGADPRCNKLYVGKRPTAPTFVVGADGAFANVLVDRKSTRLNSSHLGISYAVFCLKKKTQHHD